MEISKIKINISVLKVLNLKNKLGLFENPYGNADEQKEKIYLMNEKNLEEAKKLTQETFVLLKNNKNILPLKNKKKIALIGPYGDNIGITGSWSMFSDRSKNDTLLDILKNKLDEEILYSKGCEILRQDEFNKILEVEGQDLIHIEDEPKQEEKMIKSAIEVAKKAEVIVFNR